MCTRRFVSFPLRFHLPTAVTHPNANDDFVVSMYEKLCCFQHSTFDSCKSLILISASIRANYNCCRRKYVERVRLIRMSFAAHAKKVASNDRHNVFATKKRKHLLNLIFRYDISLTIAEHFLFLPDRLCWNFFRWFCPRAIAPLTVNATSNYMFVESNKCRERNEIDETLYCAFHRVNETSNTNKGRKRNENVTRKCE